MKVSTLALEIHDESGRRRYQIRPGATHLGRAPDNDVVLDHEDISRYHAEIVLEDETPVVRDLGATNGTYVNGVRVKQARITAGDSLVLGSTLLIVVELDPEDCRVALPFERAKCLTRAAESEARDPAPTTRDGDGRVPETWLGVLREWVEAGAAGDRGSWHQVLEAARAALGATAIVVLGWSGEEAAQVEGLAGELEAPQRFERTVRKAVEKRRTHDGIQSGWELTGIEGSASMVVGWASGEGQMWAVAALQPSWGTRAAGTFVQEMVLALPRPWGAVPDTIREMGARTAELVFPEGYVVCRSAAMRALYLQLERFATGELPILLTGETGVGKDAIARSIHLSSPRQGGPFVAVNCAAIPVELLEAELFGIEDRVATGVAARPGKMALASGGVLFLDEIGEMPLSLQPKLLRALEERQVYPVGARRPVPLDVRLVSATNADLEQCLDSGRLRRDLYYRLSGCVLRIPPLRERPGDIPLLVQRFLEDASLRLGKDSRGISARALDGLVTAQWRGNVRELQHEVWRLVHLCPDGELITSDLLSYQVARASTPEGNGLAPASVFALEPRIRAMERDLILAALEETSGNRSRAAKLLGISRYGLSLKMKRLGLEDRSP